ncbi:acyltransferase family protein [Vibrio sp. HN007]|uniref:acyltransferase family protein n=1 Tax=Vibrio iocasae TaxID=3098914 RepID=UPI0035D411D0
MSFRYDINGLRAIAVIAVVLFHFQPDWLPGGFIGVDVFFVISGFLMTGILFRALEKDSLNIFKFYVARANRIIPAMTVMCSAVLVYGWFFLSSQEYEVIGEHVAGSLGFFSNIIYWKESGYFDAASHEKWLLHTWSLSTEWQFYILYPIALLVLKTFLSLNNVKRVVVITALLGYAFSVLATMKWPTTAYYLLPMRAWEMLLGGIAYLYPNPFRDRFRRGFELIGLGLIATCFVFVSSESPWPGALSLVPVLGTYLVLCANRQDSLLTNNSVFQALGRWSYSIYLWHWPVVVFGFYEYDNWYIWGIPISLILGWLSYRFVESYRFPGYTQWTHLLRIKPLWGAMAVVCLSVSTMLTNGFNVPYRAAANTPESKFLDKYDHYELDPTGLYAMCNASYKTRDTGKSQVDAKCISDKKGGVFVWGDSHMGAVSVGLRKNLPEGTPFSQLTSSGCAPSFVRKSNGIDHSDIGCNYSNKIAYDAILKTKPDVVVVGSFGKHENNDWPHTIETLNELGVKTIAVIGPLPQWQPSLPFVYVKRHFGEEYIQDRNFDKSVIKTNNYLKALQAKNKDFVFVDMLTPLCKGEGAQMKCRAKVGDELMIFDSVHLTTSGSDYVVRKVVLDKIFPNSELRIN